MLWLFFILSSFNKFGVVAALPSWNWGCLFFHRLWLRDCFLISNHSRTSPLKCEQFFFWKKPKFVKKAIIQSGNQAVNVQCPSRVFSHGPHKRTPSEFFCDTNMSVLEDIAAEYNKIVNGQLLERVISMLPDRAFLWHDRNLPRGSTDRTLSWRDRDLHK